MSSTADVLLFNKDYGELCRSDLFTKDAAFKVQKPEWWRKEEPESSCQEEQEQVRMVLSFLQGEAGAKSRVIQVNHACLFCGENG